LITGDVLKVIDTIDVFSTKRQKVLWFGIDDLHVEPQEEVRRLRYADLSWLLGRRTPELQQLMPGKHVVTAGVDSTSSQTPARHRAGGRCTSRRTTR
jgi:hypothetical protein